MGGRVHGKIDTAEISDSAGGSIRLGGKTKAYYDTVGNGSIATKEPAIETGTIADYLRGDKTPQELNAAAVAYLPDTINKHISDSLNVIRDTVNNRLPLHATADSAGKSGTTYGLWGYSVPEPTSSGWLFSDGDETLIWSYPVVNDVTGLEDSLNVKLTGHRRNDTLVVMFGADSLCFKAITP